MLHLSRLDAEEICTRDKVWSGDGITAKRNKIIVLSNNIFYDLMTL